MTDRPAWIDAGDEPVPEVQADYASLQDNWRATDYRHTLAGESRAEHGNRIRALVTEGLAPADALAFADALGKPFIHLLRGN